MVARKYWKLSLPHDKSTYSHVYINIEAFIVYVSLPSEATPLLDFRDSLLRR